LDIVIAPFRRPLPSRHQRENHVVEPDEWWHKEGKLPWLKIDMFLDRPDTLWALDNSSSRGHNNRVRPSDVTGDSCLLVAVDTLTIIADTKEWPQKTRAVRGGFCYNGDYYCMDITDPVIEEMYAKRQVGSDSIDNVVLCISLGALYEKYGYHYKFIAAVLYGERFRT
jgi:hypothetical protein